MPKKIYEEEEEDDDDDDDVDEKEEEKKELLSIDPFQVFLRGQTLVSFAKKKELFFKKEKRTKIDLGLPETSSEQNQSNKNDVDRRNDFRTCLDFAFFCLFFFLFNFICLHLVVGDVASSTTGFLSFIFCCFSSFFLLFLFFFWVGGGKFVFMAGLEYLFIIFCIFRRSLDLFFGIFVLFSFYLAVIFLPCRFFFF